MDTSRPEVRHGTRHIALAAALAICLLLAACATSGPGYPVPPGKEATCGGITYRVLGSSWAHQLKLDSGPVVPSNNFLLVRLEMTNAGQSNLPAMWLPYMALMDEHKETFQPSAVNTRLPGALHGSMQPWRPNEKLSGVIVFDVPVALYWLRPEGCPPLELRPWWPERFGD
jgi:hypothetical protein